MSNPEIQPNRQARILEIQQAQLDRWLKAFKVTIDDKQPFDAQVRKIANDVFGNSIGNISGVFELCELLNTHYYSALITQCRKVFGLGLPNNFDQQPIRDQMVILIKMQMGKSVGTNGSTDALATLLEREIETERELTIDFWSGLSTPIYYDED